MEYDIEYDIKYKEDGRAYVILTDEIEKTLKETDRIYDVPVPDANGKYVDENGNNYSYVRAIAPPNCDHEIDVAWGIPRDIKYCKKCIYWEFC